MNNTKETLKLIYNEGIPEKEAEEKLEELEKEELIDFILWNFNRGKFTNLFN